jgi:hypothetical protein
MPDTAANGDTASDWTSLETSLRRWWTDRVPHETINATWLRLKPFINWCAKRGIGAAEVCDATVENYIRETDRPSQSEKYRMREQRLRQAWNLAAAKVRGWPAVTLSVPRPRDRLRTPTRKAGHIVSFGRLEYHPNLVAEVERYCANGGFLSLGEGEGAQGVSYREKVMNRLNQLNSARATDKVLAWPDRRMRRASDRSLWHHSRIIYRTATALHLAGEADIKELHHVADVVTPTGAAILVDTIRKTRAKGTPPSFYDAQCVYTLCSIAQRCGIRLSLAEVAVLKELLRDLMKDVCVVGDISEKNYRRLTQFDDRRVFAMLVALPGKIMAELEEVRGDRAPSRAAACRARVAVAVEILNALPIRLQTLLALNLSRNFTPPSGRRGKGKLVVFADQEKSEKLLEAPLSKRSWKLIQHYCRHYRPILPGALKSNFLFPSADPTGHGSENLTKSIQRLIKRRLKVDITVHLWRHIMGTRLGEATNRPNEGAKLLGHLDGSKASRRYIRVRARAAAERLQKITDAVRAVGTRQLGRGKHRIRRRMPGGPTAPLHRTWLRDGSDRMGKS